MKQLTYGEALAESLGEILRADERVCLIGSYFFGLNSPRALIASLKKEFSHRIFTPPIAEAGYCGLAIGAAMAGLRPIVDLSTASFLFQAFPQLLNEAANALYMTGGQTRVPVVFHILHGIRGGGAPQHSHSPQAMLWNSPGLEIMLPSSPRDVKGLFKAAVQSENPTIFVNHMKLFETCGEVPDGEYAIRFGEADVKRGGKDVTVVATSFMVHYALEAAKELASRGIDAEVVDPRTLVPLDEKTILQSVAKTGHLVIVDECHRSCGAAGELAAIVADRGFHYLKAPIKRVTTPDVPIPFSPPLEAEVEPNAEKIVGAVVEVLT